ncbi:YceI family protein [Ignavibacteriales bacterium]
MRRTLLSFALAIVLAGATFAQSSWSFDKTHSKIGFSVDYMLLTDVDGFFKKFDGSVTTAKEDFVDALVSFTIEAGSVDTDEPKRDEHLRSEDFFYTQKFPNFTFKSTSMKKVSGNNYKLVGNLTMRGVTKSVTLNGTFGGVKKDPWGNTKAGFKLTGKVNRKDYGINWSKALDGGGFVVGDDVTLNINVTLIKK